mmetsp:Transcript_20254/g.46984  ORF Transcript_20254/g.46984 Transcript_20254/m.46984 type:complete len:243 (+) Transcript_20254:459-1187(+)
MSPISIAPSHSALRVLFSPTPPLHANQYTPAATKTAIKVPPAKAPKINPALCSSISPLSSSSPPSPPPLSSSAALVGAIVGVRVISTVEVSDTPLTSSNVSVSLASLMASISSVLSASTSARVSLTLLSSSLASAYPASDSETDTVNDTVASAASSARRLGDEASVTVTSVISVSFTPVRTLARPLLIAQMSVALTRLALRPVIVSDAETAVVSETVGTGIGIRVGVGVGAFVDPREGAVVG